MPQEFKISKENLILVKAKTKEALQGSLFLIGNIISYHTKIIRN